ncbi:MAG: hypothetical protein CL483_01285 [Acidobacteria bacterium]|jgi:hypothetical protein|nr:hypothetical protein [Acidobacteriota bacterium]
MLARLLWSTLALGLLGNWLIRAEPWGINVFVGTGALTVAAAAVGPRDRISRLLFLPLLFALAVAWRAAPMLTVLNLLALAGTLALPVLRVGGTSLVTGRTLDYVVGGITTGLRSALGPVQIALDDTAWPTLLHRMRRRRLSVAGLVGLLLTLPLVTMFGALLVSADAGFERLVGSLFDHNLEAVVSHVFGIGIMSWIACGYLIAVATGVPEPPANWRRDFRPTLGTLELGMPLGVLTALFLMFVLLQASYVFGGQDLVRETAGLGYADYARRGFFELVAVAVLILPVLLAANAVVADSNPTAKRMVRTLSAMLLFLVSLIMASAIDRMRLYLDAYGLTQDRAYATAVLSWAALTIGWFSVTVLRGRGERFAFGAVASALCVLGLVNALNPDALVVRTNVERAMAGAELDTDYLASLSADAVPALVNSLSDVDDGDACTLLEALVREAQWWEGADWRSVHLARFRARRAVADLGSVLDRCAGGLARRVPSAAGL